MDIIVKKTDKEHFNDAKNIRLTVFCDEQGYSPKDEFDEHDLFSDDTEIFVAYCDDIPAATGRMILCDEQYPCKIGRIAVLKEYRKFGVGYKLMQHIINAAKSKNVTEIVVDSQLSAMGFYQKSGFTAFGEEHPDGHIMHKFMKLQLK